MTTPAEELRAAAFQLRNPFHAPGLKIGIDPDLGAPLADWLDVAAEHCRGHYLCCDNGPCTETAKPALAVARALNGGQR
jgi:hypothetical protein